MVRGPAVQNAKQLVHQRDKKAVGVRPTGVCVCVCVPLLSFKIMCTGEEKSSLLLATRGSFSLLGKKLLQEW